MMRRHRALQGVADLLDVLDALGRAANPVGVCCAALAVAALAMLPAAGLAPGPLLRSPLLLVPASVLAYHAGEWLWWRWSLPAACRRRGRDDVPVPARD